VHDPKILRTGIPFLICWGVFFLFSVSFLFFFGKTESHLLIISLNTPETEKVFSLITRLGEGWLFGMGLIYVFVKKRRWLFPFLFSWLLSVIVVQGMKKLVFTDSPRPATVFQHTPEWKPVAGVEYRYRESFPSGHTADAFAVCFALALLSGSAFYSVLLFFLAFTVGMSRIFLSQHFLQDVIGGSSIAILCTFLLFLFFSRKRAKKIPEFNSGISN
jgi:membrane-associated phospholipid phosphatase